MLSSLYVLNTIVKFIFHFQIFYKYTMVGDSSDEDLEIERVCSQNEAKEYSEVPSDINTNLS